MREIETSGHGLLSYVHINYKTIKGTISQGLYWENTTYELETSITCRQKSSSSMFVLQWVFECQAGKDVIRGSHCTIIREFKKLRGQLQGKRHIKIELCVE